MISPNMMYVFAIILLVFSYVHGMAVAQTSSSSYYDKNTCLPGPHDIPNSSPEPDAQSPDIWYYQIPTTVVGHVINSASADSSDGLVLFEVHRAWSPLGADRFYALVQDNYYNCAAFFRIVPNFIVQWGIASNPTETNKWNTNIEDDPLVAGLSNTVGMVSFAMAGPNTRTTQIFVNTEDNAFLDSQGFTPFAKVMQGMEVFVSGTMSIPSPVPDQFIYESEGNPWILQNHPAIDLIKGVGVGGVSSSPNIFLSLNDTTTTETTANIPIESPTSTISNATTETEIETSFNETVAPSTDGSLNQTMAPSTEVSLNETAITDITDTDTYTDTDTDSDSDTDTDSDSDTDSEAEAEAEAAAHDNSDGHSHSESDGDNAITISEWHLPYTGPTTVDAYVGDTIAFEWDAGHNVLIHPTMDCSTDGAIFVGDTSPTTYTFTETDGSAGGTEMFFSCDIGNGAHCQVGQFLIATVFSGPRDSDTDTDTDSSTSPATNKVASFNTNTSSTGTRTGTVVSTTIFCAAIVTTLISFSAIM